ncbi:hypothetical protein Tco_0911111 [Tanacetum coccineum]|uniref:Tf2-1-like SH3-like domain-containing protein n=1 Tax=Tanacetum coccineum TaxID=301880 RepID=A0ABQ5CUV7_9ASTR
MSMTIQSSVKDKILVTSSKTSKECEIRYHPGKANGVADALSRKAIWSRSTDPDQVNSVSSYTRRLQDVKFARIYIDEIVARNEILVMINSADGQSGCMVQTLGDIMRACVIDFGGSYHSSIRCTPFEALYGRKLVLTKEKLKAARDRQKSNTDKGRKLLEFKVGDWVMLKVSPWKGVIHFGKKGKLALRYVGPFQILEGIGPAAYSVDKTLRLVEEPIEIGDYKGVYVCVYVDYVGVGTQFIERDRLIGIGVFCAKELELLEHSAGLAWIVGTFLPLLMCCDVIKWSHDLGRGHACPSWIVVDRGDPLLLTPLCCDDIYDVTPRVSALAGCDKDDDYNEGTSRASTSSPNSYLNSFSPLAHQTYNIPTSSEQTVRLLFERQTTLLNQTQQIHEEVRGGFKLFGKALRGVFGKKKK